MARHAAQVPQRTPGGQRDALNRSSGAWLTSREFISADTAITSTRPTPRSVPLDAASFERHLRAGHGRAALDLRDHGLRDRAELLRNACLRNLAFDPQIEDDRAAWLIGLLDSVGGPGPWMGDILRALPATEDWHDALQLAHILDQFAQRGDERARAVLEGERRLARFGEVDEDGTDWVLGPWPAAPPAQERDGPVAPNPPAPTVVELEAVLERLVLTKELPERRELTRPLLRARELPYTPRAVELLAHADASIRSSASLLVERMKDPRLRAEGLRRIRADGFRGPTTSLLLRNLELEDVALLEQHLPAPGDPSELHDACRAIATLSSSAPHARWRNACLWTYEWSPCGLCRSDVVERLDEMGDVPDELRYEWRFDADATTRALGHRSKTPG